jgi:broad specificity phosphatase PhoE
MSVLTLVRHGQATPFEKDTDRLSLLGELQALALASYWAERNITFDDVVCGSMVRHRRTCEIAAKAQPAARVDSRWNEYDATGILSGRMQDLPTEPEERNRQFQRMFEGVMLEWLEGRRAGEAFEPFIAFQKRVLAGLAELQNGPSSRRVVVFTSGGPIGLCVQTALSAPDRSFLDVNWRVRNCSLTEFTFSRNRFTLDSFNTLPHLDDASLLTYR